MYTFQRVTSKDQASPHWSRGSLHRPEWSQRWSQSSRRRGSRSRWWGREECWCRWSQGLSGWSRPAGTVQSWPSAPRPPSTGTCVPMHSNTEPLILAMAGPESSFLTRLLDYEALQVYSTFEGLYIMKMMGIKTMTRRRIRRQKREGQEGRRKDKEIVTSFYFRWGW